MTRSGHVPRVSTHLPPGVGDRVAEVEAVAREHLGIDLDPWQLLALGHLTAVEPRTGAGGCTPRRGSCVPVRWGRPN